MKIYGPYTRKDGRKHAVIVKEDGTRTTKSWPRIVMESHLGRDLLPEETVDHIDNDFTNDSIENLQLLSLRDNVIKEQQRHPAKYVQLVCKYCGNTFSKREALEKYDREVRIKDGPFCSKSCVGKIHH